ncbi:MAG: transposase [Nitrospira sp.]|nr:transposase [Nitrospira sp.]
MPTISTKELTTLKIAKRYHHNIKSRFAIVTYATEHGIKGAARRFGLDRKTIRAWCRRWQTAGLVGLVPRYPSIRARRIAESTVALIEHARRDLEYGAVRTRIWLERVHRIRVAAATIRRICQRLGYPPLSRKPQRRPRQLTLFSRERPGDCVQVDVKEVRVGGTKCFQYTAIDDCTRYRILRLYPRKNQQTSHLFFSTLRAALPFPIQKLQVDNGTEFPLAFALTVQQAGMRLRYIKPRCPEQNGKVERSHRVDEEEFWSRSTFESFTPAAEALLAWERRYNHERFSMALSGLTPAEKLATFTAVSSPLPSGTIFPNPVSPLTATMDRHQIVAPEPTVPSDLSHNQNRTMGATS